MPPKVKMTPEQVQAEIAEADPPLNIKFKDRHSVKNKGINRNLDLTTENPTIESSWPEDTDE